MNNPAVKYGLIGGGISVVISFAIWFANFDLLASMWVYFSYFLLWIVFAVMAVKAVKAVSRVIDFKKAFTTAFVTFAIATFISTGVGILTFSIFDSDGKKTEKLVENIIDNTVATMKDWGAPASAIDEFLDNEAKEMPQQFTAGAQAFGWVKGLIFYAIVSLIIAAVMKSKREELDNAILDAQQY